MNKHRRQGYSDKSIEIDEGLKERQIYDLAISIGRNCKVAMAMRLNYLRDFSAPLDWMMEYSLATTLHLFETSYTDFFKECIDYTAEKQSEGKWEGKWVEDSKNIYSMILLLTKIHIMATIVCGRRYY
ncbi:DUF1796 family putative cysteine peptidase [Pseudobutyrivibrio sp.]|uniref:DUF1796 family putative cysteine peptidase n=1 Tax=Pseudobutyrivibrio sp. TaxID=2014367 RepID=UPI001D5412D4|nr:DUF1796 family putative cysteine peptidase [Pseudobutyrivibrio sp.]MBE5910560.1 hypothetical protein [Pseudobutyrivibrio sp.]